MCDNKLSLSPKLQNDGNMFTTLSTLPSMTIVLTNKCNSKCVMCNYWKYKDFEFLPYKIIESCISDFKKLNIQSVTLTGGEPLLHPEWSDFATLLKKNNISIHLMTNGLLLMKERNHIKDLVDSITVSFDGGTPESYEKIRGVNAFNIVLNGVKEIREMGKPIRLRTIIQKGNYQDMLKLINIAKEYGTTITFQQIDVYSQIGYGMIDNIQLDINKESCWNYTLSEDEICKLDNIIEEITVVYHNEIATGIIIESPENLKMISKYFKSLHQQETFTNNICNMPFYTSVIDYDLSIRPCFFLSMCAKLTDKNNLIESLNTDEMKKMRAQIIEGQRDECKFCVVARYKPLDSFKK